MHIVDVVNIELQKHKEILFAILFGSQVLKPRPDSDVDLAVSSMIPLTYEKRLKLRQLLVSVCLKEVDIVDLECAHGALLQEILTRGTILFCRDSAIYERLLNRMLREKADDSRILEKIVRERIRI